MPPRQDAPKPNTNPESPDQIVTRVNENIQKGATKAIYDDIGKLMASPEGANKVEELWNSGKLRDQWAGITHLYMTDLRATGKTNFQALDNDPAGGDGQLSQAEILKAQQGTRLDRFVTGPLANTAEDGWSKWFAKADDKKNVLSLNDFQIRAANSENSRVANTLGQAFPSKEQFDRLDAKRDGSIKADDLKAFDRTPEQIAEIPKEKQAEALQFLAGVAELKNNFDKIKEPGADSITYQNVTDFINRLNGNTGPDPVESNYHALTDNPAVFSALASTEKVNGNDVQRIQYDTLGTHLNNVAIKIKQSDGDANANKAYQSALGDLQSRFGQVANQVKGDGVGISLEDIKADYQLQRTWPELVSMTKPEDLTGSAADRVKKLQDRLVIENASAALVPTDAAVARRQEVLSNWIKFYGDPANFSDPPPAPIIPPAPRTK